MLTVLVCHTKTEPMRISLVFEKIILANFGQGYQRWKFLFFLAIFDQVYERSNFFLAFSAKDTNGESFCFFLVIFDQR